jgi:multidrug resistance efflux pump
VERIEALPTATVTFRMEVLRERAAAQKALVSQEAEVAESNIQLASLDQFIQQLRGRLAEVERHFGHGEVVAPIGGTVSTNPADAGQSLVAGIPIAEILDTTDIFVDWYVPNERLIDPKVGNDVLVLFGQRRFPGTIAQILPVSDVYRGTQQTLTRDRPATQIARVRFTRDTSLPPLNSTVYVHMHYSKLSRSIAEGLFGLFGLY